MQFQGAGRPPVGIVYDAGFGNTMDGALALAALYGFQGKGEDRVIAVNCSRPGLDSAIFADILVRFYTGAPGPFAIAPAIGLALGKGAPEPAWVEAVVGKTAYPRNITKANDTADPVAVFRNALTAQLDDNAIVFLGGPATNLAQALDLPGVKELIEGKVRLLVTTLGNYPAGAADPQVRADVRAARRVFADWPGPIVAAGGELGGAIAFPGASIEKDFAWAPDHPLVDAYRAAAPMPYDAPAPALAAALYAVRPKEGYFQLSEPGTITAGDDGRVHFAPAPGGRHRYLIADPAQQDRIRQILVEAVGTRPIPRAPRFRPPQKKQ
ncbi:MAG: hypothetical protein KGN36_09180 [Acidobacteriota bacterium]|nr:hypothetical protein [Acidobacteriota bacterium]